MKHESSDGADARWHNTKRTAAAWWLAIGLWPGAAQAMSAQAPVPEAIAEAAAEEEAYATGLEAYLYGSPRVEVWSRIQNETRRVSADQVIYGPLNRFYYFDRLARPGDGPVIKEPNNDTLYGSACLDLSQGPLVLHVPPMGDRYYVALVVDAAGSVDARIGRSPVQGTSTLYSAVPAIRVRCRRARRSCPRAPMTCGC